MIKTSLLLIVCLVYIEFSSAVSVLNDKRWQEFKKTHGKQYKNSIEEAIRYDVWTQHLDKIEELNKRPNMTFTARVSRLHDLLPEEFESLTGLIPPKATPKVTYKPSGLSLPSSFDWRQKGAITPIKYQGYCGSCWAFAATGALEAQYFIKTGRSAILSEQQYVDCVSGGISQGCRGGNSDEAYQFGTRGVASENAYPYVSGQSGQQGRCVFNPSTSIFATKQSQSSQYVGNNEAKIKDALVNGGPLSVYVCANSLWKAYVAKSGQTTIGVLSDSPCNNSDKEHSINHVVLIVGYGTDQTGGDFWIVKNSWDTWWGEQGYVRLARNAGLVRSASFPILA